MRFQDNQNSIKQKQKIADLNQKIYDLTWNYDEATRENSKKMKLHLRVYRSHEKEFNRKIQDVNKDLKKQKYLVIHKKRLNQKEGL